VKVPAAAIGLPTTGAEVTDARMVDASGDGAKAIGPYCRVEAAIHPVDQKAPDITMQVDLPARWNGRVMMFGGGGFDGVIPDITANVPYGAADQRTPLGRGYVTFASDSGHQATQPDLPSPVFDASFGLNDEAVRNFAGDALKKTRDTALFLTRTHYRAEPARSYFAGGSNGGREALTVAQRWPTDFDGVISVFPALNFVAGTLFSAYEARLLSRPGAFLAPEQQKLVYRSVIKACDGNDGLRDGVISDEVGCHFDPAVLHCSHKGKASACLTGPQIATIKALSAPLRWNYPLAHGQTSSPGLPYLSGADPSIPLLGLGAHAPAHPMPTTAAAAAQFWDQWARYVVARDPKFDSLTLDPLRPGQRLRRIRELSALHDANDPDLRAFERAGGKLLLLHGTADELVSHRSTVTYFESVVKTMGQPAVDRFARFYLIPGANHGSVQSPFAPSWDSVTALEKWAEHQTAPVRPRATDVNPDARARTRPLCEYPAWPRYVGSGNPDAAASFTCHL